MLQELPDCFRKLRRSALTVDQCLLKAVLDRIITPSAVQLDIKLVGSAPLRTQIDDLTRHFEKAGYQVGRNTPYVGVIDAGASAAIMLEIRRDVLGSPEDAAQWNRLVRALTDMPFPC